MKPFLWKHLDDILLLAGCVLTVVGVHQIYPPAAWIAAGMMMIVFAVLIGRAKANATE